MNLFHIILFALLTLGPASAGPNFLSQRTIPPGGTIYLSAVNTLNSLAGSTIPNGGSAILTWDSNNAASCAGTNFSTSGTVSGTATVSPTTTTTYTVTCGSSLATATVTVTGNLINAATGYCAANGGGSGTSSSPWHAACIQAAVNAASNGDTVLLAGGNWTLDTVNDPLVSIRKAITLVGVGSGNTFDTYGHINNASGTSSCPTAGTSITCIYQTGTNYTLATNPNPTTAGKGIIVFGTIGATQYSDTACTNDTVAHINIDGSQKTAGGDYFGIFQFQSCLGPITVQDIRHLTIALSLSTETQLYSHLSQDVLFRDSMMGNPSVSGSYGWGQAFEPVYNNRITFINNTFWQGVLNSTGDASVVYTGNSTDASLINVSSTKQSAIGVTGCQLGAPCPTDVVNPNPQGSYHATFSNNYNIGGTCSGCMFALGNGLNDPTTNGNYSDLHFTGNWLVADKVGLDACMWTLSTDQGNCNGGGMSSNAQADNSCTLSNNSQPFAITNNSLMGTSLAELSAAPGAGTMPCFDTAHPSGGSGVAINLQVYNYTAQKNYLSSSTNQAPTSSASFNRTVTGNYCSGSTFTQSDATTCATTGFTTLPTVAFTLGTYSNGVVKFASTSFTAQYGAVQWLASTSPTTPTSSDTRWSSNNSSTANSYVPPVQLAGLSHGNTTIYMWVMDSAGNISAPASASIILGGTTPFTPLHTYYMSPTGSDAANGLTPATAWATPNHAVVCGDVIVAAAGNYATSTGFQTWGTVSTCPSTSGGIDGTGGIYAATLLCGGTDLGSSGCNMALNNTSNGMYVNASNWAIEGWTLNGGGAGFLNFVTNATASGTTIIHHVMFINDISINAGVGYGTNDNGLNINVPGNGTDYYAVVGSISQNSAQRGAGNACINYTAPSNFDSAAGTHGLIYGNFAYNCRNGGGPTDGEDYMYDSPDSHGFTGQTAWVNNIGVVAERYGMHIFYQDSNRTTAITKQYNNTQVNCCQTTTALGNGGNFNYQANDTGNSIFPLTVTVTNNIGQTTAVGGSNEGYGIFQGINSGTGAINNMTIGGTGSENIAKSINTSCGAPFCSAGFDAGSYWSVAALGTNFYVDPGFNNISDLLANQMGAPNCTSFVTTTACMGYNANTSALTNPSLIYDLRPTCAQCTGKGYQLPSVTCVTAGTGIVADFPTWLKGIVYLHWTGSAVVQQHDLVTTPCGL